MGVFDRPPTFDASAPLTSDTVYVNRIAETALHHNRVGSVAFVPDAKHTDRHVIPQSAVLADYDLMALHLRMAGYRKCGGAMPNSRKARGGNAVVPTMTEVWTKEEKNRE